MLRTFSFLALTGVFLIACGGDQIKGEGRHDERPSWIDRGGVGMDDAKQAVYAVGVASNISDIGLRRSTADASARTEVAKIFSSRVQNLLKDYKASTNDGEKESAEAHREEATKVFTEMELAGVTIVNRFYDLDQNAQYALARLDANAFEAQIEQMATLSKRAKEIIRLNARRAFNAVDEESARRAEQQ